jgi:hypothetical protein
MTSTSGMRPPGVATPRRWATRRPTAEQPDGNPWPRTATAVVRFEEDTASPLEVPGLKPVSTEEHGESDDARARLFISWRAAPSSGAWRAAPSSGAWRAASSSGAWPMDGEGNQRRRSAGPPHRWAVSMSAFVAQAIPESRRARYQEEWLAELHGLADSGARRWNQFMYTLRIGVRVWSLRRAVRRTVVARSRSDLEG